MRPDAAPPPPPALPPDPRLDDIVGYQLAKAAIVADAVFERCVGGPLGMRPLEYTILLLVREHPGGSSVRLAKALGVSRPHVSLWVEKLESRGLLVRETNAADRRAQHLRVTAPGEALAIDATLRLRDGERQAFGALSAVEQLMLGELLRKLAATPRGNGRRQAMIGNPPPPRVPPAMTVVPPSPPLAQGLTVRGFTPPLALADFGLAAFDMDSTLISIECIDEIADAVGRKAEVAAITEAAMRGEIVDFRDSLQRRLALLAGVPESALHEVYEQRLRINPGVERFLAACRDAGLKTLLVSGGFTFFSDRVRDRLGIDFARANVLEIEAGALTGRLVRRPWGEVVDGAEKRRVMLEVCELLGLPAARAIAVGDGANDLPMMDAAGLSIAFHAKPAVRERAMVSITRGGMDRALEVLTG